jgi:fatty-acyl-CoA synthase
VELENALMGHPAVHEAAVIAVPDPNGRNARLPWSYSSPGDSLARLTARIPCSAFPEVVAARRFEFVDEIPRTATGKFLKRKLREIYSA